VVDGVAGRDEMRIAKKDKVCDVRKLGHQRGGLEYTNNGLFRARILRHLLEAEKSTFREGPSFQRSESTAGLILQQF
jgi:predicted metal-binding protein